VENFFRPIFIAIDEAIPLRYNEDVIKIYLTTMSQITTRQFKLAEIRRGVKGLWLA
jgi:hypothetical protein